MTFEISEIEEATAQAFINIHEARHGRSKAVDGARYTYEFTPGGIGTAISIRCSCNEKIDITDWDVW